MRDPSLTNGNCQYGAPRLQYYHCIQVLMWAVRGREWNGSFAETDGDEWAYSAYVSL